MHRRKHSTQHIIIMDTTVHCSIHKKRRVMSDLKEIPGQPGQFQCAPGRECRTLTNNADNFCMCSVHGKRRVKQQMREVTPGVWECLPMHICRNVASSSANAEQTSNVGSWAPIAAPQHAVQLAPTMTPWGAQLLASGSSYTGDFGNDVWCAKHGKRLPRSSCDHVDANYYVCLDEAACTASALSSVESLKSEQCKELLCDRHKTIRLINYLVKDDTRNAYVCSGWHACRASKESNGDASLSAAQSVMPRSSFFS